MYPGFHKELGYVKLLAHTQMIFKPCGGGDSGPRGEGYWSCPPIGGKGKAWVGRVKRDMEFPASGTSWSKGIRENSQNIQKEQKEEKLPRELEKYYRQVPYFYVVEPKLWTCCFERDGYICKSTGSAWPELLWRRRGLLTGGYRKRKRQDLWAKRGKAHSGRYCLMESNYWKTHYWSIQVHQLVEPGSFNCVIISWQWWRVVWSRQGPRKAWCGNLFGFYPWAQVYLFNGRTSWTVVVDNSYSLLLHGAEADRSCWMLKRFQRRKVHQNARINLFHKVVVFREIL